MLSIKFFASLRERLKCDETTQAYSPNMLINELVVQLVASDSKFSLLQEQDVLVAVNKTLTNKEHLLQDNDEVAFFPPVTGG